MAKNHTFVTNHTLADDHLVTKEYLDFKLNELRYSLLFGLAALIVAIFTFFEVVGPYFHR